MSVSREAAVIQQDAPDEQDSDHERRDPRYHPQPGEQPRGRGARRRVKAGVGPGRRSSVGLVDDQRGEGGCPGGAIEKARLQGPTMISAGALRR